ncbi:MAG: aminoacyltransferase, partial [Erysipelothrix sp.]|nr:aminoacyltransferase [Erysipelothrix sp.]
MHITIQTIDEKTYTDYTQKHEQASFWQTPAMGKRRKHDGWTYELIGFYESEHLVGAALLFKRHILLGRYAYECYNGPILEYDNAASALAALKQYLIEHKAHSFIFNPNLTAYELDALTNIKHEVNNFNDVKANIE